MALLIVTLLSTETAAAQSLPETVATLLAQRNVNKAQTGIMVVDLARDQTLVEWQPDLLLNPASCLKIITAAAVLKALGPDHRIMTHFYGDRGVENGAIKTLWVKGGGDPSLVIERLWRMGADLKRRGLTKIQGDIVLDESFFDAYEYNGRLGDNQRAYNALTSALALNFNSVTVTVTPTAVGQPATVTLDPPIPYFQLQGRVTTGKRDVIEVALLPNSHYEAVQIRGTIAADSEGVTIYRSISQPVRYFGTVLKDLLASLGISVGGSITTGRVPEGAMLLLQAESVPLAQMVRDMNKFSNNFIAEQLIKHLGAVRHGAPGTTDKGIRVVRDYLSSLGIKREEIEIENGSGLSTNNRVTARQLMTVLKDAYHDFAIQPEFITSLSIAGTDGTIKRRPYHPTLVGQLRAKTGTLSGVSTLVGYLPMANGHAAGFVILMNGVRTDLPTTHRFQERMALAIREEK